MTNKFLRDISVIFLPNVAKKNCRKLIFLNTACLFWGDVAVSDD